MIRPLTVAACLLAATSASAHDWYSDLESPGGERCCTERDCQPVDHRYDRETGRLEVGIEGVWVPVDSAKVVATPSADGAAHACFMRHWMLERRSGRSKMTPVIRCVILPGEV